MNIPPLCFVRFARPAPIIQRGIFWYSVYRHLRLLVSPALLGDLECFINRIGEEIQEETLKKLWERRFTLNYNANVNNWYRLYYDMRNEEFRKLKQKEDEIFVKKDIKIKEGWKKLKPEQVYAWLHKLIIQSLIGGKINSDE